MKILLGEHMFIVYGTSIHCHISEVEMLKTIESMVFKEKS